MLSDLTQVKGEAILEHIKFEYDESINNIVASWPARIDNTQALALGFKVDSNFQNVIQQFIEYDM